MRNISARFRSATSTLAVIFLFSSLFLNGCDGGGSDSLNLSFIGTVENLEFGPQNSTKTAAAGVQVCALGGCDVTNQNGQFSFKVDGDQFTGGDVLFQFSKQQDWNTGLVVENIPSGPGVVSFKFALHDNTVFGGLDAFDQSCVTDNLGSYRGCAICSYTLMIDMVVRDYWETGEPGCYNCGSYIRSKTWQDSQGFWHDQVEEWEYVRRASFDPGNGEEQIDPAAVPQNYRGVTYLISRVANGRYANYVQITPEAGGGVFGNALHLSVGGQLVFAKFVPFEEAIRTGNDFITAGSPTSRNSIPSAATTESAEPVRDRAPVVTYRKGNVSASIYKTQMDSYSVGVSVDDKFVVTVYKDCNTCPYFYFFTAEERAKTYLELLQGWRHN